MKILLLILFFAVSIAGQETELDRAINAYQSGDYTASLTILTKLANGPDRESGKVWKYIGLANIKIDKLDEAATALSRAVALLPKDSSVRTSYGSVLLRNDQKKKAIENLLIATQLDPKDSEPYYLLAMAKNLEGDRKAALDYVTRAIDLRSAFPAAFDMKSDILVAMSDKLFEDRKPNLQARQLIQDAIAALELCNRVCDDAAHLEERGRKIEGYREFLKCFGPGVTVESINSPSTDPNFTAPVVISKPRASYTDEARINMIQGKIRIVGLFDTDGKVKLAFVIKSLGYGLDEDALRVVRMIKFTPAGRNGKPVPVVRMVEYTYTIY